MGFLDKLKEGAEQAKDLAAAAAERAKDEAKELGLKRQLGSEREALGEKVYALVQQGTISHADLDPHVAKIRELTAEIDALHAEAPAKADGQDEAGSAQLTAPAAGSSEESAEDRSPSPPQTPS
jgi:uncharacterized coiled-coil DUF342 family protein